MSGKCSKCGSWIRDESGLCNACRVAKYNEEKLVKEQLKAAKRQSNAGKKMHWKYFFICGWLIGILSICFVFPLFIKGLVARAFGYW